MESRAKKGDLFRYKCEKCFYERDGLLDDENYSWNCPRCGTMALGEKVEDKKRAVLIFEFDHPNVEYFDHDDVDNVILVMKGIWGKNVKTTIGSTYSIDLKAAFDEKSKD